jgi:phage pi2 protein 07
LSIDVAIPGDRNVIKKEVENILKYKELTKEIQRMWNMKANVIPRKNRRDVNYPTVTQTTLEKHTMKARNRGITETSHIWHCTQTVGSANVKVQNIFHWRNNITCNTNCK